MKMQVEKSIEISATPERIWPLLIDPEKIVMWFDTFKKCEYLSDKHSGVGTTYYVEENVIPLTAYVQTLPTINCILQKLFEYYFKIRHNP